MSYGQLLAFIQQCSNPMKSLAQIVILAGALDLSSIAADAATNAASIPFSNSTNRISAEQDHRGMMDLLHITSLRPGRDGGAKGKNPANYDEAKANPFPDLP